MSTEHPPLPADAAAFDDENPEWTVEVFARAGKPSEVLPPGVQEAFVKARGRPRLEAAKVAVKLRLDPDVVEGFKAGGPGWQTRINATLKAALVRGPG